MEEQGKVILKEEMMLEKKDEASGVIVERIKIVTDYSGDEPVTETVLHEFFDTEGNPLQVEGGKDGTN